MVPLSDLVVLFIIMDNDSIKSYNAWNQVEGIVLDISMIPTQIDFYSEINCFLEITGHGGINDPTIRYMTIGHEYDNTNMVIGIANKYKTFNGSINFSSAAVTGLETNITGNHYNGIC